MKKIILLLMTLLLLSATLFACGSSEEDDVISFFTNNGNSYDGATKDAIWLAMEENSGVEIEIKGLSHGSSYYTKLNPLMNTIYNMPDVVFTVPTSADMGITTMTDSWTKEGQELLWSYDELISQKPAGTYQYVEELLNSDLYGNIQYNEQHYILPNLTSKNSWAIYYREDWLVNVGEVNDDGSAKTPVTIEDFARVLQKFTTGDPDGNGVSDTYGFAPSSSIYWAPLYHAFGVAYDWDFDEEGNIDYMYTCDEYYDFLTWANEMYRNKYIYPTYTSMTSNYDRELFQNGKVGIMITNAESHIPYIFEDLASMGLASKVGFGSAPIGTANLGQEGAGGFPNFGGWWGGYSITKACSEEKAHNALKFLDYTLSPEGSTLRTYGIEGTHYNVVDGEIVIDIDGRNASGGSTFDMSDVDGVSQPVGRYSMGTLFGYPVDWDYFEESDGEIEIIMTAEMISYEYKDIIQDAFDKIELYSSNLVNVTAYSSTVVGVMSTIQDTSTTFIDNAITGESSLGTSSSDTSSKWYEMITKLKGSTWEVMVSAMKETLIDLGIMT